MSFGNPFAISGNSNNGYEDLGPQSLGYNGFEVSLNYISGIPDPSIVSNSQLKLIFKSLQKKDELTKEKALLEFINFINDSNNLTELKDDLVIITWIQLYPKISISESKNVRLMSHQIHTLLISKLQKNILKYLKDSIPILFTGLFDFDSSVSKSTQLNLSIAFNNDEIKLNNLWNLFQSEILNFIDNVFNKETVDTLSDDRYIVKDEADLKYLRLINSTVAIFNQLIKLNKNNVKFTELLSNYQTVFTYENLWHYLLINSNVNNQKIFKSLLNLINSTLINKPELFVEKSWKLLSKRFLKSLKFVDKFDINSNNSIIYSSLILPILTTLINLNSINPDFYHYVKSSKDLIINFLKIGSLNSNPNYYKILSSFINNSKIILLNDNEEDFKIIEEILLNDFDLEVSKNLKFRSGADFIINSLITYLEIITNFNNNQDFTIILEKCLNIQQPSITSRFIDPLSKHIPQETIITKLNSTNISNWKLLLEISIKSPIFLEETLIKSLDNLRDLADHYNDDDDDNDEEREKGEEFVKIPTFTIFQFVINKNLSQYSTQIEEFIDELPSFITPLTLDQCINILIDYSKFIKINKQVFLESFDNSLAKLNIINSKDQLITKLDQFNFKDELLHHSEELRSVVNEISTSYDFQNDNIFQKHLIDKQSLINLYKLAESKNKLDKFVEFYWKNNSSNGDLLVYLIINTDILNYLFKSSNIEILTKIESLLVKNIDIKNKFFISINQNIQSLSLSSSSSTLPIPLIEHLKFFISSNPSYISDLIPTNLYKDFLDSYGEVIDSRLSLGNPLETGIYLLSPKIDSFQFQPLRKIIDYAIFLNKLDLDFNDEVLIFLNIIHEVAIDYDFLISGIETNYQDQLVSITNKLFLKGFKDQSHGSIIDQIITDSYDTSILSKLLTESNPILNFYKLRILISILNNFEPIQDQLDLEPYIKSKLRSKDINDILRLITILTNVDLSISKYERLRNLVGSELIGLRPNEILSQGLSRLILLNRFIENSKNEEPLQPQRFNMIINELNKWIESDISYESDFTNLRIVLLKFLQNFNLINLEKSEKFQELTENLITDSIGFITMNLDEEEAEDSIELKYQSLKLYLILERQGEEISSVKDEIFAIFLNESFNKEQSNQPIKLYNDLLIRFIQTVPTKKFVGHYDELLQKNNRLNNNFQIRRPILQIISELILTRQQDVVIEYELNKDVSQLDKFKIESKFIENVLKIPDFNGLNHEEEDQELIKYLWNWSLILLKFNDISLKLRSIYISQLQSHDELIFKFLNFLTFLIINNSDKEILNKLNSNENLFLEYSFDNNNYISLDEEIKFLSIHLYYKLLISIGSLSTNWFNNIKDRNFKNKIEDFTIKYISPSLILTKLQDFETKSTKLINGDDNLTIKLNKTLNEIKINYLIDEQQMEVLFKIPSNYPLNNIEIIGTQRIGVKELQWKSWVLSSQTILSFQNGSILESLEFFLKNVSYHFKGFEECSICYSILHSDNSLPSKTCSTCNNKFHSACLYKWFKSSGGNTCPLCRSTFNFR
ncbi:hypothetical protein WICMUC_003608 [Wickerhamomyces mucosus]|uniref:E3 ubiquitin-protein ligase listerin n=1 Tax=Wickerhamomyces mucosus TaxID=1378264 RepID=A0A9P8PK01_9ASCO|nr:hypothetical protein WICMUC_003608 [Wickerhamomyces mucosus]